MIKKISTLLLVLAGCLVLPACDDGDGNTIQLDNNVLVFTTQSVPNKLVQQIAVSYTHLTLPTSDLV